MIQTLAVPITVLYQVVCYG